MIFQNIFRFLQKILPDKGFRKISGRLREVRLVEVD